MAEISGHMLDAVKENFDSEGRPERWAELAPSTLKALKRKGKDGGKMLNRSAAGLFHSINAQSDATSASVRTNKRYARIHQFGGTIKHKERSQVLHFTQARKGKMTFGRNGDRFSKKRGAKYGMKVNVGAHETTIPARPYLHLEPTDLRRIMDAAKQFLSGRP
jgi:phage virion morphogenesis protein